MNVIIRRMRAEDLQAVVAIDQASFSLPWPARSFQFELNENPNSRLWVAEVTDAEGQPAVAGLLVLWKILDEGHIATVAVSAAYRRLGVGRKLLAAALLSAAQEGVTRSFLEVRASNTAAQTLYQRFGYIVEGVRRRYYKDNQEDALQMSLYTLNPAALQCLLEE